MAAEMPPHVWIKPESQIPQWEAIEAAYAPPFQATTLVAGDSRSASFFYPEPLWSSLGERVANIGIGGTGWQTLNWQFLNTAMDLTAVTRVYVIDGLNNLEFGQADPIDAAAWGRTACNTIQSRCPALAEKVRIIELPWVVNAAAILAAAIAEQTAYYNRLKQLAASSSRFEVVPSGLAPHQAFDPALFGDGVHPLPAAYEQITAALTD